MMRYLYVCNWKMFMDCASINSFLEAYAVEKVALSKKGTVVVCPPFCFLDYVSEQQKMLAQDNALKMGAQDCSQFLDGAYTGEISAYYLKEAGCQYCIIGHVERRRLFHENDQIVLAKTKNLLASGIAPIICVGPSEGNFPLLKLCDYVKQQVSFFIQQVGSFEKLFFAYEPYQAIGANKIPDVQEIAAVCAAIKNAANDVELLAKVQVLYGGSVDEHSVKILKIIQDIDGFLIGRASTDFQKLKNIISY